MDAAWERAVTRGDVEAIRQQLRSGADINARDQYGQTALMLAAHHGHYEVVEALVASGADLNVTAEYTQSALMLAILAGHADIARFPCPGWDRPDSTGQRGAGLPGEDRL
jgi:ankyrin repeat protein